MEHSLLSGNLNLIMWNLLIITAVLFCIFGVDDFIFDIIYWFNKLCRKNLNTKQETKYSEINAIAEQKIAIMIPCWHEHLVIGNMLEHNLPKVDYKNYDIFVGVYLNDPDTIKCVKKVAKKYSNLHTVICSDPGPTTKSDNLNNVYRYILKYEQETGVNYTIFILHDSEDIIHPLALKLYNTVLPEYDMVQTPVLPIPINLKYQLHWIYNDEFAEMHVKDMLIRNIISGFIPSAGVGTAYSRKALVTLAENNTSTNISYYHLPFGEDHLTEDYDSALRIHLAKLKMLFLSKSITTYKSEKNWKWFGKVIERPVKDIIATRSLFPRRYLAALRQRTRWMIGIALQEWENLGWPGNWRTRYLLFHDRKVVFTNILGGIGYICFIYWLFMYIYEVFFLKIPSTMNMLIEMHPWVFQLIILSTCLTLIRLIQRFFIVKSIYGILPAVTSIPRFVLANILNANTSFMAIYTYLHAKYRKQTIKWNKTTNTFPTDI